MTPTPELYEFGEFTLDAPERRILKHDQPVALAPKAYDVLLALLRNAGRLVTKRELLDAVWPEAFVEEGILAVHVSGVRKALGDAARFIETVPRAGYRFSGEVRRRDGGWPRSVAVLPSAGDSALGLALADALIDRLDRPDQIVVRPPPSVVQAVAGGLDPAEAGRSLRVDAVLEASFRRTEDRVQVSARLIRSQDSACLWHTEFKDLPAARQPEAYELFGRGRAHLLSASMFEVPKAVEAFRAAIELDPSYAAAHAGLALAHCAQAELRVVPYTDAYTDARAAALRALGLDDSCADAQVALGAVLFLSDWNWVGAERSLARALQLNPNHTEAYLLYGRLLEAVAKLSQGLAMKQKALERDPFSPLVHLQIALSYFLQRRYDDSITWTNKALEIDPRHLLAGELLASAYWMKGDYERHLVEEIGRAESHGVPSEALAPLRGAFAAGGRLGVVRYILDNLAQNPGAPAFQFAVLNCEAGNIDAAFTHLDQAIDGRDPSLVHLAVGPQWDRLRSDPRFERCLARMNLRAVAARTMDGADDPF